MSSDAKFDVLFVLPEYMQAQALTNKTREQKQVRELKAILQFEFATASAPLAPGSF